MTDGATQCQAIWQVEVRDEGAFEADERHVFYGRRDFACRLECGKNGFAWLEKPTECLAHREDISNEDSVELMTPGGPVQMAKARVVFLIQGNPRGAEFVPHEFS